MLVISKTEYPERLAEKDGKGQNAYVRSVRSGQRRQRLLLFCPLRQLDVREPVKFKDVSLENGDLEQRARSSTFMHVHHCTLNICSEQFPCLLLWTDPR